MTPVQAAMQMADLEIQGLDGGLATRGVCSALQCIRGVESVDLVSPMRLLTVTYDAQRVNPRQLQTAVRAMGCEIERMVIRDRGESPAAH